MISAPWPKFSAGLSSEWQDGATSREPASAVSAADKSATNGESGRITGVNTLACETEMAVHSSTLSPAPTTQSQDDRNIVLAAVQLDGRALQHASAALQDDREIVLAAVQQNGRALKNASAALRGDREIVLAAVQQNGSALQHASAALRGESELWSDREFVCWLP